MNEVSDRLDGLELRPKPADGDALRPLALPERVEGGGLGPLDEVGDTD